MAYLHTNTKQGDYSLNASFHQVLLGKVLSLLELSFLLCASILWSGFRPVCVSMGEMLKNFPLSLLPKVSAQQTPFGAIQKCKITLSYNFHTSYFVFGVCVCVCVCGSRNVGFGVSGWILDPSSWTYLTRCWNLGKCHNHFGPWSSLQSSSEDPSSFL